MPQFIGNNSFLDDGQGSVGGCKRCFDFRHSFEEITSVENLLEAWREFSKGKRKKKDVQEFSLNLMDNILDLHRCLRNYTYVHGQYQAFNISDPKPRNIHKATVQDRLLHHAVYRILYPFFDKKFIYDSYSCRLDKGTHRAINRFRSFAYCVSQNHTRTAWVLKCDIKKFFASIDHKKLVQILDDSISDKKIVWLLERTINSFHSSPGTGLPLGNLTSQLLVNVYMNEFDQFMKHGLKASYYIRYADDFVILSDNKMWLLELLPKIASFLSKKLKLSLHPDKISIRTIASGVDFLGWVHFPDHRVLRTSTKRRMMKRLQINQQPESVASYFGLLGHGNTWRIQKEVKNLIY